jgi:hypothetical protein
MTLKSRLYGNELKTTKEMMMTLKPRLFGALVPWWLSRHSLCQLLWRHRLWHRPAFTPPSRCESLCRCPLVAQPT